MLVSKQIVNLLVASAIAASATASVSSQPTAAVERHGDMCAASGLVRDALKLLQRRVFGAVEREVAMPVQHLLQEAVECAAQSCRWRGNVSKKGRRDSTKNVTTMYTNGPRIHLGRADAAAAFAHWKQLRASSDLRP